MRPTAAVALAAMLALSAAACTLPGTGTADEPPAGAPPASAPASEQASDPATAAPSDPVSPTATDAPSDSTPVGPTPADPDQPPSGDQLGQMVATRTSADGGKKVTLQLYPVQRDGRTSHLNLTLSSAGGTTQRVQVGGLLSDGNYSAIDKGGLAADGLQLVDGKNAKLYLVASDGQGQCLCSRDLSSVFLSDGAPVLFSATFAAPPADVTQVDVRIPSFGTVKNVPVQ
jgi:hypothetical protein